MTVREEKFSDIEVEELREFEDADFEEERFSRRSRPWLLPLLLGTGLGIAIAFGGMRLLANRSAGQQNPVATKSAANVAPSMTVTVAPIETTRIARTLNTTGTVTARDLIPVLPQTNGLQIKQVLAKEGDSVKQGQVLAILDDSVLQDQIRQARAEVESKQADVGSQQADLASKQAAVATSQANVASRQAVVQQRQADVAQAKARLEEATQNLRSYQQLANAGAISKQELLTRTTTVATATQGVRLAEANVISAEQDVLSAQAAVKSAQANVNIASANINSAQAAVKSSNAKVEQVRTQQGQTVVRAPVSGLIAERLVRVGDVTGVPPQAVQNGMQNGTNNSAPQRLFSIISNGSLELQALIPDIQLPQVKIDAPAQVTSDLDNRVRLQGRVREIQPVINQLRREATVKIDLPQTNLLKPGTFARAAITTNTAIGMAAPQKAVLPQPDGSASVFILSGEDTVRAVKVEVGEILIGGRVEIKRGVKVGDRVVVDGAGYIKDGDKVRVVNRQ
jgi:RND family efflux transporter MFP subunit